MKKLKKWVSGEENGAITPNVGDLIMYDWDKKDGWPEHVGIVESVNGNTFTVIEGNKNDAVGRRTVTVGSASIRGFVKLCTMVLHLMLVIFHKLKIMLV